MRVRQGVATALGCLALYIGSCATLSAAESRASISSRSKASLVTDVDTATPGVPFHAALRLQLAPNWHVYWQNPGDAGIPPKLDVTLPPEASAGPIQWPFPQRVAEGSLTTYAYTGDVVLPFDVTPHGDDLRITAHAEWLVCKDLCVPEEASFELNLPSGSVVRAAEADLIVAALSRVPRPAPFVSTITQDGILRLSGPTLAGVTSAQFIPITDGIVEASGRQAPEIEHGALSIKLHPLAASRPEDRAGVVILTGATGSAEAYTIDPTLLPVAGPKPFLAALLVAALVGGLLLNLMPCVFPILAMKAFAIARLAGTDTRRVRTEAISYSLGVITSFVTLGAGLVALRSAGELSGWGFQYQSPRFVIAVAWILFAIGLNLSGVFTIGNALVGRGDGLTRRRGHVGSFMTGVLAVVVASPCTAPFMGAAIAGALALTTGPALVVFAALGTGLALPYAMITLVPGVICLLPRPGPWMRTLQQLLAFPMYAAAVWLAWVTSQQVGPPGVLSLGAGFVALGFGAWLLGQASAAKWRWRLAARIGAVGVAASLAGLLSVSGVPSPDSAEPFTLARLGQLRAEGRPVFVNMTAAWCLSCLLNERVALAPLAVKTAFAKANVAYLKGDWTRQDPTISAFLHQLGQDGVPLYALYTPGQNSPLVLPQILSESTILIAIGQLKS